jgi:hypothetical protein
MQRLTPLDDELARVGISVSGVADVQGSDDSALNLDVVDCTYKRLQVRISHSSSPGSKSTVQLNEVPVWEPKSL